MRDPNLLGVWAEMDCGDHWKRTPFLYQGPLLDLDGRAPILSKRNVVNVHWIPGSLAEAVYLRWALERNGFKRVNLVRDDPPAIVAPATAPKRGKRSSSSVK